MADTRRDKRAPVSLKVRFKSATIDEFVEQYSVDISRGGLFIKSKKPMKVGTLLKFELQLKDESRLIHGVGRVVWRREAEEASDKAPAGMGIKFIKMGADSRTLVQQIVESRGDQPGTFDEGTDGPKKKEGGFFPDEGPAELPNPEDRTQVRHASEFLAEALSDSDGAAAEAQESAEAARKRTEEIQKERAEAEERRKAEEAAAAARLRAQEEAAKAAAKAAEEAAEEAEEAEGAAEESEEAAAEAEAEESEDAAAATVPDGSTEAGAADTVPADESPAEKTEVAEEDEAEKKAAAAKVPSKRPAAPEEQSSSPWGMVAIVLLLAAGVGGYFWWSSQQAEEETPEIASEPEEPVEEEPLVEEEPEAVMATVHIESNVPAEISANGESLGTTPLDASLTVGESVTLVASAAGHGSVEQTITPAEAPEPVTFELAPLSYVIVVETTPEQARVTVNGNHAQSPARIELDEPVTGELTVAATKPGFRLATTTVTANMFVEQGGALVATVHLDLPARATPTAMTTMTATMMAATTEMATTEMTETTMETAMEATMEAAMEAAPMEAAPMETPPDNPF